MLMGLPGAGKSTLAGALAADAAKVRFLHCAATPHTQLSSPPSSSNHMLRPHPSAVPPRMLRGLRAPNLGCPLLGAPQKKAAKAVAQLKYRQLNMIRTSPTLPLQPRPRPRPQMLPELLGAACNRPLQQTLAGKRNGKPCSTTSKLSLSRGLGGEKGRVVVAAAAVAGTMAIITAAATPRPAAHPGLAALARAVVQAV